MAKFNFLNLNDEIRALMLEEINLDVKNEKFFISNRLNDEGKKVYKEYLIQSVTQGDEESFEILLNLENFFHMTEFKNGKETKVPKNASTLLCQSEFNRYYIRGICLKAIKDNIDDVEVYRGRESSFARSESDAQIGRRINAIALLNDLRSSIGSAPQLFPEINSGLTVKL